MNRSIRPVTARAPIAATISEKEKRRHSAELASRFAAIAAMCVKARRPNLAAGFIRANASLTDVRTTLGTLAATENKKGWDKAFEKTKDQIPSSS
jgi:hypothetical protein